MNSLGDSSTILPILRFFTHVVPLENLQPKNSAGLLGSRLGSTPLYSGVSNVVYRNASKVLFPGGTLGVLVLCRTSKWHGQTGCAVWALTFPLCNGWRMGAVVVAVVVALHAKHEGSKAAICVKTLAANLGRSVKRREPNSTEPPRPPATPP